MDKTHTEVLVLFVKKSIKVRIVNIFPALHLEDWK